MRKRCIHELTHCILNYLASLENGCDKFSRIMHQCLIDVRVMYKLVEVLKQSGFITEKREDRMRIICITNEGREFLKVLDYVISKIRVNDFHT